VGLGRGLRGLLARGWGVVSGLWERCLVCGALLDASRSFGEICPACARALAPRLGGYCPACGDLSADPEAPPMLCPRCRTEGGLLDGVAFHGRYEGALRELVLDFKFHGRLGQARLLGNMLAEAWRRAGLASDQQTLLVPVPLHPRRLAWRGFNQSLELARVAGRRLELPVSVRAMARIRHTTPQSQLPGARRLENIQGAFRASPEVVGGRAVVLVDDVMTTGATVETAARALRQAGAARVAVLVVAR
jgi:ComF family protein